MTNAHKTDNKNNILLEMYTICDFIDYFWGYIFLSVLYKYRIVVFTIIPIYSVSVKEMKVKINKQILGEIQFHCVFNLALYLTHSGSTIYCCLI
jgi:hypothetical protein